MSVEEAVGGELKELEYLTARTRHLQEAVSRGGCVRALQRSDPWSREVQGRVGVHSRG